MTYYLQQVVNVLPPHGARHRGEGEGQDVRDERGEPRGLEVYKFDLYRVRGLGGAVITVLEQNIGPP